MSDHFPGNANELVLIDAYIVITCLDVNLSTSEWVYPRNNFYDLFTSFSILISDLLQESILLGKSKHENYHLLDGVYQSGGDSPLERTVSYLYSVQIIWQNERLAERRIDQQMERSVREYHEGISSITNNIKWYFCFLDASTHLYMRVCPSVGRSVRPSIGP